MDLQELESEVRRLSPWYYRFDLGGITTDITAPCDLLGHREEPRLPDAARLEIAGKTVLDCACNEGGYSFSALDCGAAHVDAFDVREVNIEKAALVARVRGVTQVNFQVASCDRWIAENSRSFDFVFLCGLLYHLVEPWRTIGDYAPRANSGVFLTCMLAGGADGYTPLIEENNLAASEDPSEASMMPNSPRTIMEEFVKHGLQPVLVSESRRSDDGYGGCSLFFRKLHNMRLMDLTHEGRELFDLYLAPGRDGVGFGVMVYNRSARQLSVTGTILIRDASGELAQTIGPGPLELDARVAAADGSTSTSEFVELPLAPGLTLPLVFEIELRSREGDERLAHRTIRAEPVAV